MSATSGHRTVIRGGGGQGQGQGVCVCVCMLYLYSSLDIIGHDHVQTVKEFKIHDSPDDALHGTCHSTECV